LVHAVPHENNLCGYAASTKINTETQILTTFFDKLIHINYLPFINVPLLKTSEKSVLAINMLSPLTHLTGSCSSKTLEPLYAVADRRVQLGPET
jgi:hypothetical protein